MEFRYARHGIRRVLLVDDGRPASLDLAEWLREQPGLRITGPWPSFSAALTPARLFLPHIVILELCGLAETLPRAVKAFKALRPSPQVFLVTHCINDVVRRHARAAAVDAAFDKSLELESLARRLAVPLSGLPEIVAQRNALCVGATEWS
jgi:DNA-binding NarL/FixJ family response regulator